MFDGKHKHDAVASVRSTSDLPPVGVAVTRLSREASAELEALKAEVVRLHGAGEFVAAIPLAERLLALQEAASGPVHGEVASWLNNLAMLHVEVDALAAAEPLYLRAIQIHDQLGGNDADLVVVLCNLASIYRHMGAYPRARPLYERVLRMDIAAHGQDSPEAATVMHNLALVLQKQGEFAKARALFELACSAFETLGSDHPMLAITLNNFAGLYHEVGDYPRGMKLCERALRIREEALGVEHPDVAVTLASLGGFAQSMGAYDDAKRYLSRALRIQEKNLGADHPAVAVTLNNLAVLEHRCGELAEAERLHERALHARERAWGSEHPEVANSLHNLAELHHARGDHARAKACHDRALRIREHAFGSAHPEVAYSLNGLGGLYHARCAHDEARSAYERSLAIRERALGEHPETANSLTNLARLHQDLGAYGQAELLYERALVMREHLLGRDHPDVAIALNNLAVLYDDQGAFERARPYYQRALALLMQALGAQHPLVANALGNLAMNCRARGELAEAEQLHAQALAIHVRVFGAEHPTVARQLNNLGGVHQAQGRHDDARSLFERALQIHEHHFGAEHIAVARQLHNLAGCWRAQGELARTAPLYQRALHIFERVAGPEHPVVADVLRDLGALAWAQGDRGEALAQFTRADAIQERHVRLELSSLPEPRKRQFLRHANLAADLMVAFHAACPDDADALALALTVTLRRKGRVLQELVNEQAALYRSLPHALHGELRALQDLRAELATRRAADIDRVDAHHVDALQALAREVEQRDQALRRASAVFRTPSRPVTVADVQAALASDTTLVEFVCYPSVDFARGTAVIGQRHYAAYVVSPSGAPGYVVLGEAAEIEAAVATAREALARPAGDAEGPLRALDELVFAPIRRALGPTDHVVLSPDAALHLVPFAALVDDKGRPLVERMRITYVTSGRDLLRPASAGVATADPLVIAAPDYCGRYTPLDGATAEATALQAQFANITVYVGAQATKHKLTAARSPRFAHIATHGFFRAIARSPIAQRSALGARDVGVPPSLELVRDGARDIEDALDVAGLIFAGENDAEAIAAAREIAAIDLSGTQLVVLSACDTGIGEVEHSEGIYGLRRALAIAGAETQVVSLWKVDDNATSELMQRYYQGLCAGGGRSEALRCAQLDLLRGERYAHPYYWAAFVPIGDERPL